MAREFCTIDPPFPVSGFAALLLVSAGGGEKTFIPYDHLVPSLEQVASGAHVYMHHIEEEDDSIAVEDVCVVMPVVLDRRYPLRREFWESPDSDFGMREQAMPFLKACDMPEMYSLLVTPYLSEEGLWQFRAALPILNTTPDISLERFMLHSTWPVSEQAKYAAVYRLSVSRIFNWATGQVVNRPLERFARELVH